MRAATCATAKARGFTLLEMMIAMAILAGALTWITAGVSRAIKVENHAKLITTATFLARGRMSQLEDDLYEKGFGEFDKETSGAFDDKGFKRFAWKAVVDKVELPNASDMQNALGKANEVKAAVTGEDPSKAAQGSPPAGGSPLSMGASAMASQFGMIKEVLEQAIRRVTVRVTWTEGTRPQEVAVVAYFTDPRRVDQAINLTIPNLPPPPK